MFHLLLHRGLNDSTHTFLVTYQGKQDDSLRTFFVTRQGKRQRLLLRKNITFFFTKPTCPPRKPAFGRLSRRAALELVDYVSPYASQRAKC